MMGNISTLAINAAIFAKLPYDPQKSFTPISMVARQPLLVAVNPNRCPPESISELIALGKSKPGGLSFGSAGASLRLATEAFNQATGLQMTHVPYRGSGPAMTDLVAGHIDVLFDAFSSLYPFTQEGKLRALAITSAKRSRARARPSDASRARRAPSRCDVLAGYSWSCWTSSGGRDPSRRCGSQDAPKLGHPGATDQAGCRTRLVPPQELAKYAAEEIERWKTVAQVAGIKPE